MNRLFPKNLLHSSWLDFQSYEYDNDVCGVIYRGEPKPSCGMPLGGIDTGCIDIETNGMLGYATIFNDLINPRLLYNCPFLGININDEDTYLLISDNKIKYDSPKDKNNDNYFSPLDYTIKYKEVEIQGLKTCDYIDYFGHYPVLDMEYHINDDIEIGLRSFSPFVPGKLDLSIVPGIYFQVFVRNKSNNSKKINFIFSFPGFGNKIYNNIYRDKFYDNFNGVTVKNRDDNNHLNVEYSLSINKDKNVKYGSSLDFNIEDWCNFNKKLPQNNKNSGTSISYEYISDKHTINKIDYVLTWSAPYWNSKGSHSKKSGNVYKHMYHKYYNNSYESNIFLTKNKNNVFEQIKNWQNIIYSSKEIPSWLSDSLINNLHLITECSIWSQSDSINDSWNNEKDGLFALNECPRGCPQLECIPCSFYGNIPLNYFFPETILSTLRGYKYYQFEDGSPPWIFGGITAIDKNNSDPYEICRPDKGYQTILNGSCYIIMFHRFYCLNENKSILNEFWESLKKCNDYSMNLRPEYGLSQVVSMPTPGTDEHGLGDTEWFEAPEPGWKGYVTHAGGIRIAQLQIMKELSIEINDNEYLEKCNIWIKAGKDAINKYLWNGKYYNNYYDKENEIVSDYLFAYQLDGQWITRWHNVSDAFDKNENIKSVLEEIKNNNCRHSQTGAVNYINSDGTLTNVKGYGPYSYFPPELFILSMTFMYYDNYSFGLNLLYKCLNNIICKWGYTWDAPNTIRGDSDTGERAFGSDYYQNMMLWSVLPVIEKKGIKEYIKKDSIINQIINCNK